ncbi:MAG: hypothetical protein ACRDRJ_23610 [Streptosporangiaceae bacterium]
MLKRTLGLLAAAMVALTMSATAAFAAIPAHPKFKSSAKEATWHNSNFMFQNDMWSCPQAACNSQTIWANGPSNWGASSNMANGNTAVLTYPDIARIFNNPRVSSFNLIRNGFAESMPKARGLSAEAADDVWLDNYKIEVMMWVDNTNRSLAGSTHLGSADIYGQHMGVYRYGSSEYIFNLPGHETTGETHILSALRWMISHGYAPANATLTNLQFGWEIASTGGKSVDFKMSRYWLHTHR